MRRPSLILPLGPARQSTLPCEVRLRAGGATDARGRLPARHGRRDPHPLGRARARTSTPASRSSAPSGASPTSRSRPPSSSSPPPTRAACCSWRRRRTGRPSASPTPSPPCAAARRTCTPTCWPCCPSTSSAGVGRAPQVGAARGGARAAASRSSPGPSTRCRRATRNLNLRRLGATATEFLENFYGVTTSSLHHGLPTDRLLVRWDLNAPRVRELAAEGEPPRTVPAPPLPAHQRGEVAGRLAGVVGAAARPGGAASCCSRSRRNGTSCARPRRAWRRTGRPGAAGAPDLPRPRLRGRRLRAHRRRAAAAVRCTCCARPDPPPAR